MYLQNTAQADNKNLQCLNVVIFFVYVSWAYKVVEGKGHRMNQMKPRLQIDLDNDET